AAVLSMAPTSLKSTMVSERAEIRDIRRRLTKVERQAVINARIIAHLERQATDNARILAHLEALNKRLDQIEAREKQRTAITPQCNQQVTSDPPRTYCGRRLFGAPDSDEGNVEQSPAFLPATPAYPRSSASKKNTQLPDVPLRALAADHEETLYKECLQRGERRPDVYAASVFMALCPFEAYQSWAKQVNWNGSNGKDTLPKNLKDK
ncbi:zinc finger protein, partial [Clarias magur]